MEIATTLFYFYLDLIVFSLHFFRRTCDPGMGCSAIGGGGCSMLRYRTGTTAVFTLV